jgi:hypothetical protein
VSGGGLGEGGGGVVPAGVGRKGADLLEVLGVDGGLLGQRGGVLRGGLWQQGEVLAAWPEG